MEFKEQLREQVDIVRVVGDYVRLRRVGKRYAGLCPFHNEKTPSFSVSPEHQYFKCFGCDAKGDVFKFVELIEGLTFFEALKKLADQHGMSLPKQSLASDEDTRARAALYEMHEIAANHFRANLASSNGAAVRAYLTKRGVGDAAAQQFGLGLADGSGRSLTRILEQRGFKPEQMEASGLVGRRDDGSFYDRFRNRLMFPIQNESGKTIAFGGRALDPEEKAKYLNSPETKIYKKSHVLYNLHRAKAAAMKLDRIVLVEGYMDVIGTWQAGVTEVVATCGTALTVEQIDAMRRHSLNFCFNFDPDSAGANAAERSIVPLLERHLNIRVVELKDGLDPDEFCLKYGGEAYQACVASAQDYFYWRADKARARFNVREMQGRIEAFRFLINDIHLLDLGNKLERLARVHDLAAHLGVEQGAVLEEFRKSAADRVERAPAPKIETTRATDRILLPLLVNDAEAREKLAGRLRDLGALRQLKTAPIFDTLLAMHEAGESVNFNALHERLEPAMQDRLAAIVLDSGSAPTLEDGLACVEALRHEDKESQARELKLRIKSAEREGRIGEAMELARQLGNLMKSR